MLPLIKFAGKIEIIKKIHQKLISNLTHCIEENILNFNLDNYYVIEDVWLDALRKISGLMKPGDLLQECPKTKYALQAKIAKIMFIKGDFNIHLCEISKMNPRLMVVEDLLHVLTKSGDIES